MVSGQTLPSSTIRDWCKQWLESKSLEAKPRTHERYESSIRHFLQFLGPKADQDLESLSVSDVLGFRDEVAKRLSVGSTNLELKILRACLYAALRQDLMEKNVAAKVEGLKQRGEGHRRAFALDEVRNVLKQCDEAGGEWRGLVLMGLYTGQRLGDVASLTWSQVDLLNGRVSFLTSKSGKRLEMAMAKPLSEYWGGFCHVPKTTKKRTEISNVPSSRIHTPRPDCTASPISHPQSRALCKLRRSP